MLQKNDEFEITITDLGSEGEGIGRYEGMTFFIPGTVPGDSVIAGVTKIKKTYGYARLVRIIEPSKDRTEPFCPIARKCGGCQLQHLSYEAQLKYKEKKVREDLTRLGGCNPDEFIFHNILGMDKPMHYRNKGQFPVGSSRDGRVISGFFANHTHSIIEAETCPIQHEITDYLMRAVRNYMDKAKVRAYDEAAAALGRKAGVVRHVLTRVGWTTHEVMVCIVINAKGLPATELLVEELKAAVDEYNNRVPGSEPGDSSADSLVKDDGQYKLTSLTLNINTADTNVIMGDKCILIYGSKYIEDYIGDVKYRISPQSFYQVNPMQTRKLYSTALEYARLTGNETVWDLYCGIGTISLFLARNAYKVYGVEIVPQAIEDAQVNASINGITNAEFYVGAAESVLPAKYKENPSMRADVVVVDPPRKGCEESLLDCVVSIEPKRIVYVSCDPATLARDVKYLREKGYELKEVQPVDMFGQSSHVETVVCMSKKNSKPKDYVEIGVDAEDYYKIKEGK